MTSNSSENGQTGDRITGDEGSKSSSAADQTQGAEIDSPQRRLFLNLLSAGLVGFVAVLVAIPFAGFLFAPSFESEPRNWIRIGPVEKYNVGDIVEAVEEEPSAVPWGGVVNYTGFWLYRRAEDEFVAYSVHCTHLGCPVRWEADAELFMCPCHGGVYYKDGNVAAGPPPRPLFRIPTRINNGQVEIQATPAPIV